MKPDESWAVRLWMTPPGLRSRDRVLGLNQPQKRSSGSLVWWGILQAALVLAATPAPAQPDAKSLVLASTNAPTVTTNEAARSWSFSVSAYTYLVPESRDYLQPTFMADRGWLHLEARYNYEGLDTGSAWVGYNVGVGKELTLQATAMLGGVFGDTTGIAPGYRFSLDYWKLELASEGEYLFDTANSSGDFFSTWSELSISPVDWLRVGLAVQRTKLYHTALDIQRGFLVGFHYKRVDFTTYVLNLGWTDPTLVFAVGVSF